MGELLTRYRQLIYQFARFAGIGFLNTGVDFIVTNLLIALTGITAGAQLSGLVSISFAIAVTHSFIWNKYWAFASTTEALPKFAAKLIAAAAVGFGAVLVAVSGANATASWLYFAVLGCVFFVAEVLLWKSFRLVTGNVRAQTGTEFTLFIAVSLIGLAINAAVVGVVTGYIVAPFGIQPRLWANVAKVLAVGISLVWNFVGYKIFVFKK